MEILDVKVIFKLDNNKISYQGEGCLSNEVRRSIDKPRRKNKVHNLSKTEFDNNEKVKNDNNEMA